MNGSEWGLGSYLEEKAQICFGICTPLVTAKMTVHYYHINLFPLSRKLVQDLFFTHISF
jgi:hypothetical protein